MSRRGAQLWAASGALSVLLFGCGLLFGDLLGTTNFPPLDATASRVRAYLFDNASEVRALSFLHLLSAVALLAFVAYIHRGLRRDGSQAAMVALLGGATAATFLLCSALCYRTLAETAVANDAPLAHALVVLSYLTGGPAIAVPMALMIGCATATPILPRWIRWLGGASVLFGISSAATMLGPSNNRSAVYGILLIGALLAFVWLAATSVVLATREGSGSGDAS